MPRNLLPCLPGESGNAERPITQLPADSHPAALMRWPPASGGEAPAHDAGGRRPAARNSPAI